MLRLENISKIYNGFMLRDISLGIERGEYFILLGRSGSGKSQLLEIIAGLRPPDTGEIYLNGINITREKIQKRKIGMVFQDYAIFPHLTVFENIAYPLKIKHHPRDEINKAVNTMAENVNIRHLLDRRIEDLSGGEKQRVAVARTLVTSPEIILLDEPMASIDAPLRDDVRRLLRKINSMGITMMHVTHDYSEAVRLAHRVGVIHNGKILQVGDPESVFTKPANRFVARFAGIRNFFSVKIYTKNDELLADSGNCTYRLNMEEHPAEGLLIVKSDSIRLSRKEQSNVDNCIKGVVTELNRAETGYELFVDAGDVFHVLISKNEIENLSLETGQPVYLSFAADQLRII